MLFGDARLGLGYNINNDGSVREPDADGDFPDDLRAVSRVRFGVNMTGATDSGIAFGATIRADNALGGQGGENGQTAGSVFVSGDWGTLTFGDTNGADEQWVGDVPGNFSLTGLTDLNETRFIWNGGQLRRRTTCPHFTPNPFARPTLRYDFDHRGLRDFAVEATATSRTSVSERATPATSVAAAGAPASVTTGSTASPSSRGSRAGPRRFRRRRTPERGRGKAKPVGAKGFRTASNGRWGSRASTRAFRSA